ncbi:MAG: hypothetical protein RKP20_12765 [Candidatus Competibacter sp.]|nr:hypothetical protein [Candidatus Competibacter sp.]
MTFAQAVAVWLDAPAPTVFDAEHGEFEERGFILGPSGDGKLLAGVRSVVCRSGLSPRTFLTMLRRNEYQRLYKN